MVVALDPSAVVVDCLFFGPFCVSQYLTHQQRYQVSRIPPPHYVPRLTTTTTSPPNMQSVTSVSDLPARPPPPTPPSAEPAPSPSEAMKGVRLRCCCYVVAVFRAMRVVRMFACLCSEVENDTANTQQQFTQTAFGRFLLVQRSSLAIALLFIFLLFHLFPMLRPRRLMIFFAQAVASRDAATAAAESAAESLINEISNAAENGSTKAAKDAATAGGCSVPSCFRWRCAATFRDRLCIVCVVY